MDMYQIGVILFLGIQFRTGHQNQAKSSLEQGQVSEGPGAHPHQNVCPVPPPPPPPPLGGQSPVHLFKAL